MYLNGGVIGTKAHAGFLVPLSLFIVLGAATLAIAMSQIAAGSRSSAVFNTLSTQALYATDAGVQKAMHELYYGNETRAAVDASCAAISGSTLSLTGAGVNGCVVSITCALTVSDAGDVSLYSVVSQSECGQGEYKTGRRVRVEAYMQNN